MTTDEAYRNVLIESSRTYLLSDRRAVLLDPARIATLSHRPTMELIKGVVALTTADPTIMNDDDAAAVLVDGAKSLMAHLDALQGQTGLFDGGDNLVSPPDTSFTINDVCLTLEILSQGATPSPVVNAVRPDLLNIALRVAPALKVGGIHTPNHRWEIASALSGLAVVLSDLQARERAEEWLAEGLDIQPDGLYSERSPNYAAYVSNCALISMARRLDRPDMLDIVHRAMRAIVGLIQPDDDVETVQSRRQDQFTDFDPEPFLSQARLIANVFGDDDVAAVARRLAKRKLADPCRHLAEILIDPRVGETLPEASVPIPADKPVVTDYRTTRLSRVRFGGTAAQPIAAASVYAGSDFPFTGRIASGLANNPTIVDYAVSGLAVAGVRLSPDFFDLGPVRPTSISREGLTYTLVETRASGYYQPLPKGLRRSDGVYPMSDEGRFFACMAFDERQRDDMTLTTVLEVAVRDDGFDLTARFDGPRTRYACRLGLVGKGLRIEGASRFGEDWLAGEKTAVTASANGRKLVIEHECEPLPEPVRYDPGEAVSYTGGNDRLRGEYVLICGATSAPLKLSVRFL